MINENVTYAPDKSTEIVELTIEELEVVSGGCSKNCCKGHDCECG